MKKRIAKWLLAALAFALFVRTLLQTDLVHAATLVRGLGPVAPLLAIPALLVLVIETLAWQLSLRALGRGPGWRALARIRLATDAVLMSVPGGVVVSEYLIPVLLRDRCGMPLSRATAASVARKWLGTRAHAVYIFLAVALGWGFLEAHSERFIGVRGLPWVVVGLGLLPLSMAVVTGVAARRGDLSKIAPASLRDLAKDTDVELGRVMSQPARTAAASTALYLVGFLCEALEAFAIARALGSSLTFVEVLAVEAGLSMVRSVAFFAPSGIGIQDVGYVGIFGPTIGPAFVLVKRARELVWIIAGWLFLGAGRARGVSPLAARDTSSSATSRAVPSTFTSSRETLPSAVSSSAPSQPQPAPAPPSLPSPPSLAERAA